MDLTNALQQLGLDDIDTQLRTSNEDEARAVATTWMLVEAAVTLMNGKKAILIGRNLVTTKDFLVRDCLGYITRLGARVSSRNWRRVEISTGSILFWESQRTVPQFWELNRPEDFAVFADGDYQIKAHYRAQGPLAQVRVIRPLDIEADHYGAYDEDNVFLFDLPGKTVDKLLRDDPYRVRYGGPDRPV